MPKPPESTPACFAQAREGWLHARSCRVLLAVSGGPDSVALACLTQHLAPELQLQPILAHMHHGFRGPAADRDRDFVAQLASSLGLPFVETRWMPRPDTGFEESARNARYAWLTTTALELQTPFIATGHTQDDQVETILHRILRGTGIRGLAGIPHRRPLHPRVTLIRPLLQIPRQSLLDTLQHLNQPYCVDATNHDLSQTRARIRHRLLPLLRAEFNPQVHAALLNLSAIASENQNLQHVLVKQHARQLLLIEEPHGLSFNQSRFLQIPRSLQIPVLRFLWNRYGFPEQHMGHHGWRNLVRAVRGAGSSLSLPGGIQLQSRQGRIALLAPQRDAPPAPSWLHVSLPGQTRTPLGTLEITPEPHPDELAPPLHEMVDADQFELLASPDSEPSLIVRNVLPGDRFEALGMPGASRRVGAYLRTRGVPASERRHALVLCDDQGIVWVVGHRLAHRVRVTETTRRRLRLSWHPHGDSPPQDVPPTPGGGPP